MKTVKITRDSVAKIIDFPQDYKAMQQEIGADLVERVKTRMIIKFFGSDVSFLCDEDFGESTATVIVVKRQNI